VALPQTSPGKLSVLPDLIAGFRGQLQREKRRGEGRRKRPKRRGRKGTGRKERGGDGST